MPKMSKKKVNMILKKSNVVMTKKKKNGKYQLVPRPTVPYDKVPYTA